MENLFGKQEQHVTVFGGRRIRFVVDEHGNIHVDEIIFTPRGHTIKVLWQETVWLPGPGLPGKEGDNARE